MKILSSRILLCCALLVLSLSTYASGSWDIQGKTYQVDTLYHTYVGPGTTQTSVSLSGPSLLKIFYTTTDLTNPYVEPRVLKGNDKVVGVEGVSSMAKRNSNSSITYFAGVNADFFGNSQPIGNTMMDGEIINTSTALTGTYPWQAFGIGSEKTPYLGLAKMTVALKTAAGTSVNATSVNTARYENYLVLYSQRYGSATGTNIYGYEVKLMPVNSGDKLEAGTTVKYKVVGTPSASGNMSIPSGGYVLSGNGTSSAFVQGLKDGDIIDFTPSVTFNDVNAGHITQVVGGQPMILSAGVVLDTEGAIDHLVALNPRTGVGFTADKKNLVMLIVDGRSSISAGCTSKVLADIMKNVGCSEAMNFDGGGSSDLYIKELGIRNVPSDGTERAVTNGLFLASSTPEDNTLAQIRFTDLSKKLPKYGYYTPVFYGYNKYGVLINTDVKNVVLSCPASLGEIRNNGTTLFCNGEGTHPLTATINGISVSLMVTVSKGDVSFRLADAIVDGYSPYKVETLSEINGEKMPLDNQALAWSSDDNTIATVDQDGNVSGVKDGETTIHGILDSFNGAIKITVEKPTSRVMPMDPNMDISTWTITQTGGQNMVATAFENGMKLSYTGASGRAPNIKIAKKLAIWSIPDTLRIRINPGDASIKSIAFTVRNRDNAVTTITSDKTIEQNKMNVIDLPTVSWCDATDRESYPINLAYLYFTMNAGTVGTAYTIEIPGLEAVYKVVPAGVESVTKDKETIFVYPNPVVEGEPLNVRLTADAKEVIIYDVDGKLIKKVEVDGNVDNYAAIPTSGLSKGIYFISIGGNAGKFIVK